MQTPISHPSARWLISPKHSPHTHPRLRLFCFPSAGGGPAQYRPWMRTLPEIFELQLIQLPGREARLREPLMRRMPEIVTEIGQALLPMVDQPYAFFGHSMGALLAFEVARWLRRTGAQEPVHLFVSGRRAPNQHDPDRMIHALDDAEFLREIVARYNGIPQVILDDPELLQIFLPTLRADLEVIETYQYAHEAPLHCALTAFAGFSDQRASLHDLQNWRAQTTGAFRARQFAGEHFYLQNQRDVLLAELLSTLKNSTSADQWPI